MLNIQEICEGITNKIALELELTDEKKAVINYGLFAIIQTGIAIGLSVVFGIIFQVLIPTLIISFSVVFLRKYSGGAHSNTPIGCAVIGAVISVGAAIVVSNITYNIMNIVILGAIIYAVAICIVYRLAPVDSKAKPIKSLEKQKMLKRKSILVIIVYLVLSLIEFLLYLYSYNENWLMYITCLYAGIVWQVFTLTSAGHISIAKTDNLFNKLMKKMEGNSNEKA